MPLGSRETSLRTRCLSFRAGSDPTDAPPAMPASPLRWITRRQPCPIAPARASRPRSVMIASAVAGLRKRCRQALSNGYSVHESADRGDLERGIVGHRPAAVLLDITLPGLGGASGIASIQKLRAAARIIVLTEAPDEREGIAILKAGARGYCHRDIDIALLEKATHVVLKGEIWVGRKLIPHLLEELTVLTEQRRRDAPGRSRRAARACHPARAADRRPAERGGEQQGDRQALERDGAHRQGSPHGHLPQARALGAASARPVRARAWAVCP